MDRNSWKFLEWGRVGKERFRVPREQVMTVREAASYMERPLSTLYSWVKAGRIQAYTEEGSSRLYLLRRDLDSFLESVQLRRPG